MCKFPGTALLSLLFAAVVSAQNSPGPPTQLPGLTDDARITRDTDGIAHIRAQNEHDLFFLQGYVHAQDRLFQMDVSRREASGTLAELLGPAALAQDVQLRTIGLRRAAVRTISVISPRAHAALQAYADGVNAYVATHPGSLPPEYGALELTQFEPWTVTDSLAVAKLISFGLSFDLDINATVALLSYQGAGSLLGFDGTKLFFEDLDRSAPFDPAPPFPTLPSRTLPRLQSLVRQVTPSGRPRREPPRALTSSLAPSSLPRSTHRRLKACRSSSACMT